MTTGKGSRSPNLRHGTMSPKILIAAGAQAAAQGLVRSALLTKLLPFAGAVSLLVGLFGRKGGTETRPAAGVELPRTEGRSSADRAYSSGKQSVEPAYSSRRQSVERAYTSRIRRTRTALRGPGAGACTAQAGKGAS